MKSKSRRVSAKNRARIRNDVLKNKSVIDTNAREAAIKFAKFAEEKIIEQFPRLGHLIKASKVISIFRKKQADTEASAAADVDEQTLADTTQSNPESTADNASSDAIDTSRTHDKSKVHRQDQLQDEVSAQSSSNSNCDSSSSSAKTSNSSQSHDKINKLDDADESVTADLADDVDLVNDDDLETGEHAMRPQAINLAPDTCKEPLVIKRNVPRFNNSMKTMLEFINHKQHTKKAVYA